MRFEARSSSLSDGNGTAVTVIVDTTTGKRVPRRYYTNEYLAVKEAEELSAKVKGPFLTFRKPVQAVA